MSGSAACQGLTAVVIDGRRRRVLLLAGRLDRPSREGSARVLRGLARRIDAFQDRVGRAVSWLMFGMVLVVFTDVILRYVFNRSAVWAQELEWHLFGVVYLLAAGYTLLYDEHVRVDILYSRWPARKKAWFDFVLLFVFFFPSCLMIIATTWPFVRNSFAVLEGSPDPGGLPARWALKAVILVGFGLLILQGISQAIKSFYVAMGWEPPEARLKEIL
jgi:TRAP-type mannitol/chloroaromatic compound transport system permease small subunit